ncbi:MAG: carbohydrate-binding family 9-like protein [Deltaproteobacteria bacterium]|nr:carbohydrate-binding family 9-like protein [Deltaproteobacteria bacterium]
MRLPVVALLAVGSLACVEKEGGRQRADRERAREFIARSAPSNPARAVRANLEGKIELVGVDAPAEVRPGEPVEITWHWHCIEPVGEDWRLFTHVHGGDATPQVNADGDGTVRDAYPPSSWRRGEYVRDVQEITLPRDFRGDRAVFYVGIWQGESRLRVRSGPSDGNNRIRALEIPVARSGRRSAEEPLPEIHAKKTEAAPAIDGKVEEPAWRSAATTGPFGGIRGGASQVPRTIAKVLWNDDALFVAFECEDRRVHSTYSRHDDELWNQDVVEVFLDPGGQGRGYYELQVSPASVVFDSFLPGYRQNQNDWSSGMQAHAHVDGTLDDDDEDRGWSAEMKIPFAAIDRAPDRPPRIGATWRVNFFRLDLGPGDRSPRGAAWSPPLRPDFHQTARFGRLVFDGLGGAPAP